MTAREWFQKAQQEGWAIGAFNVDNLEIFRAICIAGKNKKSPVMMEFSPGEVGYFGLANIVDLVVNVREEYGIPILLNLDHAKKVEDCLAAISQSDPRGLSGFNPAGQGARFDDVHFDGSDLSFEENVEATKKVVEAAHAKGLLVEGEIDRLPGSSEVHTEQVDLEVLKKSYTDPAQATKFVQETGVDIFAAVFGNVHGTYPAQPDLDFGLLTKIRAAFPNAFLSMHGGSGIPAEQVKEAIKVGKIVKVNVNTELRQAYRDALAEKLGEQPNEYTMYKLMPDVILAVTAVVEAKIEVLGSANKL
jgi:fructose-bisphosphate aldolase, class II